jgi:hypothetical protein
VQPFADDDPYETERKPLPSGVDPWKIQHYTESEYRAQAQRPVASARWWKETEEHGVETTCETCGKVWKVHPVNAGRTYACSQACRDKAYQKRKREGTTRPLVPKPHKPWMHRKNARKESE